MVYFFLSYLLLLPVSAFAASKHHEAKQRYYRFAEAKSVTENEHAPPELEITFDINCNEEFVQLIRHERSHGGKVTIALGALLRAQPEVDCAEKITEKTVPAGRGFSGKDFEVSRISTVPFAEAKAEPLSP